LAGVWRERTGADVLDPGTVTAATASFSDATSPAVVLDDVDQGVDELALLHLYNAVVERKGYMLLTAVRAPRLWTLTLPDLRSRISALPSAAVAPPDDQLLAGILVKLFADRQLTVGEDVIWYLVARMERSFAAARSLVDDLDKLAMSEKRRITVPLIRDRLDPP
jgi:chromosomal replication initiation ATPase DnaA